MTRVAILGCGPAGMFAAHAATGAGCQVDIFSKPRKSYMRGAQYLHRPIPGLSTQPFKIDYRLVGSVAGYRDKVYGDDPDLPVSPQSLVGIHDAWDIREAYDNAWSEYGRSVRELDLDSDKGFEYLEEEIVGKYDIVISTVPAKLLCYNEDHVFSSEKIWSTSYVKHVGIFEEKVGEPMLDNVVICSGDPNDWWYRQSRIQGYENTEFPHTRKPVDRSMERGDGKSVWEVEKPVSTDCDCWPEIRRLGRYGSWRKGVLSHEAYYDTERWMLGEAA